MKAIVNTQNKTSAIFSASKGLAGVTWLPELPASHSKLPQQDDPYWYIACWKTVEAVLLYVILIAFSASLFFISIPKSRI